MPHACYAAVRADELRRKREETFTTTAIVTFNNPNSPQIAAQVCVGLGVGVGVFDAAHLLRVICLEW